jgi:hypothetical protein
MEMSIPLISTAVIGVFMGAYLTSFFSSETIERVFGIFLIYPSLRLIFSRDIPLSERKVSRIEYGLMGLIVGITGGFLGLGGGVILMPLLLLVYRVSAREAVATSLFLTMFTGLFGSISHYIVGNVDLQLAIPIALGVVLGAQLGARSLKSIKTKWIQRAFGLFLLYMGIRLLGFL